MFRSLLLLVTFLSFSIVQFSQAAEIGTHNYDIYVGDINSDGDDDFYFHGKQLTLILHGDIATPIVLTAPPSFVIYRDYDAYQTPMEYSLTSIQIAAQIAAGTLTLYKNNTDFYIWNNGLGVNHVLLRGGDIDAPALLLSSSIQNDFPLIEAYLGSGGSNISDRNQPINIRDINYDGRKDIIVGSSSSSLGEHAYVADSGGLPATQPLELTPSTSPTFAPNSIHVGTTGGEFRVDESGAATYKIPLALPEGVAGVTPELWLDYSSLSGNGMVGRGWQLGGLSSITRCRQTLIHDNAPGSITWSSNDRFCLDGQRLMVVSGGYGEPDSTYKTELDSFVIVTARGGVVGHPEYFTVEAKDGSTSVYGNTADSKVSGNSSDKPKTVLTWSINRFQDNMKNSIEFVYEGDATTGHRLAKIFYAFKSVDSSSIDAPRTNVSANYYGARVDFSYENRSDVLSSYVAGYEFKQTKRLQKIEVRNRQDSSKTLGLIREYRLQYMAITTADNRYENKISRLESVQECLLSDCLPALRFSWGGGSHIAYNGTIRASNYLSGSSYVTNHLFADYNGDGKQDIAYFIYNSDSTNLSFQVHYSSADGVGYIENKSVHTGADALEKLLMSTLDYNADGRQDLAVYTGAYWRIYMSEPQANGRWKHANYINLTDLTDRNTVFADINSDGLADAITPSNYRLLNRNSEPDSSNKAYSFSSSTSFSFLGPLPELQGAPEVLGYYNCSNQSSAGAKVSPEKMADFNGDGVVDFIVTFNTVSTCDTSGGKQQLRMSYVRAMTFQNNKLAKYAPLFSGISEFASRSTYYAIDINGDGLTDIATKNNLNGDLSYRINTGSGLTATISWFTLPEKTVVPQFIDYNGDGTIDLSWAHGGRLYVRLWGESSNLDIDSALGTSDTRSHYLADITGDGIFDHVEVMNTRISAKKGILSIAGSPIPCTYQSGPWGNQCMGGEPNPSNAVPVNQQHHAIYQIDNGIGNITKINYGTLANSGHYSTTDVQLDITTQTTPEECYRNPEGYIVYCRAETTYHFADAGKFYERLNGGWDLPEDSNTLIANNATKGKPVLEIHGAVQVVTSVESSAPAAASPGNVNYNALSKVSYYYGEAKMQASGRGFLGFARLKTVDEQTGISTVTTYRQDFPFSGKPLSTTVYSSNSDAAKVLQHSVNTWNLVESNLNYFQVNLVGTVEKVYDLNSSTQNLLQTVTTATDYDSYGNSTRVTVTTEGKKPDGTLTELVQETVNEYGSDDNYKAAGRLTSSSVTTGRDSESATTRVATFTYYPKGGTNNFLLQSEKIDDGAETTYHYDSFGNKIRIVTKAKNHNGVDEEREAERYFTEGRYLYLERNALGHQTKITTRNVFGLAVNAENLHLQSSTSFYDSLGREYMTKDATGAWQRTDMAYCSVANGVSCPTGAIYRSLKRSSGGGETIEYFDVLGRNIRTTTTSFDGRQVHVDTEYDSLSRVSRQSNPYYDGESISGWTHNHYDILGRVISVTAPDNSIISSSYKNNVTTITNSLQQKRIQTRDGLGQLIKVEDDLEGSVNYTYDVYGELLTATTTADGTSVTVRMCYDKFGRKVAMHDPDKGGFNIGTSYKGGTNATKTCDEVAASLNGTRLDGWWYYSYNGFGELTSQIDTKGQKTTMTYDLLGRMKTRTDYKTNNSIEGYTEWFYDTAEDGTAKTGAKGQATAVVMNTNGTSSLCSGGALNCHRTVYNYDDFGRPTTTQVYHPGDATAYTTSVTYDKYSRPSHQYDVLHQLIKSNGTPQTSGVEIRYNLNGYEQEVIDLGSGQRLEKTLATNARGQVTSILRGNGATTTNTYDEVTGLLTYQHAGVLSPVKLIQHNGYGWDTVGNLTYRYNQSARIGGGNNSLQERFCYDKLNRLTRTYLGSLTGSCTVSGTQSIITYNGHGNITSKTGVGSYTYGSQAGPHAVTATTTGNKTYQYDNNGNMISDKNNGAVNRSFEYTTYDQVALITKGGLQTAFYYGPDRSRWQRINTKNSVRTITRYLGSVERIETEHTGSVEWKRSVAGALFTYKTDTGNNLLATSKLFIYKDHLGSVDIITNTIGDLTHSMSFDAWGARRSAEAWNIAYDISKLKLTGFSHEVTKRGYTGHEMVDEMDIIHMNGRIYDAKLGRFLQADPFIQAATNTQSFNRYSYLLNNPLNATDPSGFFLKKLWNKIRPFVGAIVAIVLTVVAPVGAGFWYATFVGAAWGMLGAAANGGDILRGALTGAVSAAAFYGIGSAFQGAEGGGNFFSSGLSGGDFAAKVFAHGMVGGVMSSLQGGKFGHGFTSAGLTQAFAGKIDSIGGKGSSGYFNAGNRSARIATAAAIGGTASRLSGGKFANGAITGAFSRAFNDEAHARKERNLNPFKIIAEEFPKWFESEVVPKFTVYTGGDATFVPGAGPVGGIGSYFTTDNGVSNWETGYPGGSLELGSYTSVGGALGLDMDASLGVGLSFGDLTSYQGGGRSLGFDFGPVSLDLNFNATDKWTGFRFSVNTPLPGISNGVSKTTTRAY